MSRHSPKEIERIKRIARYMSVEIGSANSEWPAKGIVRKLIEAADLLLDHCDYDGDGWEEIHLARSLAHSWAESPNAVRSTTEAES